MNKASQDRLIFKNSWRSQGEVRELLQSIIAGELLSPSPCFWLVSPWISDINVLDNRSGRFSISNGAWFGRQVSVSEVLSELTRLGCEVRIAMRPDAHNEYFAERLMERCAAKATDDLLTIARSEDLHEKGILGQDFYLSGSMNLTFNGVELLEEAVRFTIDPSSVGQAKINYLDRWGGRI
jgi:hypothetical protein